MDGVRDFWGFGLIWASGSSSYSGDCDDDDDNNDDGDDDDGDNDNGVSLMMFLLLLMMTDSRFNYNGFRAIRYLSVGFLRCLGSALLKES